MSAVPTEPNSLPSRAGLGADDQLVVLERACALFGGLELLARELLELRTALFELLHVRSGVASVALPSGSR